MAKGGLEGAFGSLGGWIESFNGRKKNSGADRRSLADRPGRQKRPKWGGRRGRWAGAALGRPDPGRNHFFLPSTFFSVPFTKTCDDFSIEPVSQFQPIKFHMDFFTFSIGSYLTWKQFTPIRA